MVGNVTDGVFLHILRIFLVYFVLFMLQVPE